MKATNAKKFSVSKMGLLPELPIRTMMGGKSVSKMALPIFVDSNFLPCVVFGGGGLWGLRKQ